MSKYPPTPKGWSTERRGKILIGAFNTDDEFDLPEPYVPLLAFKNSATILIQCGKPGSPDSPKSCFVLYDDLSEAVSQILAPTNINELWTALSFYGTDESDSKGPKLKVLTDFEADEQPGLEVSKEES